MKKIYWTTKKNEKIDIDEMSIEHLRNTLKMIVRQSKSVPKNCPHNTNDAIAFSDEEVENEDNFWK
jgi:hypothetical protein